MASVSHFSIRSSWSNHISKIRVNCIARKRFAPEPMARQFLDGNLPDDPRTRRIASKARSLYLFGLVNKKVIGELDKLTEELRAALRAIE